MSKEESLSDKIVNKLTDGSRFYDKKMNLIHISPNTLKEIIGEDIREAVKKLKEKEKIKRYCLDCDKVVNDYWEHNADHSFQEERVIEISIEEFNAIFGKRLA